jgi:hypothetical protein
MSARRALWASRAVAAAVVALAAIAFGGVGAEARAAGWWTPAQHLTWYWS